MAATAKYSLHKNLREIHLKLFSSESTEPIVTKLWWNGPFLVFCQNCVQCTTQIPATKMTAVTEKKGGWNILNIFFSATTESIVTKL